MALLGIYVGVIPIALGMLWLPWIRRIPRAWLRGVMALTVGLLAFLAIDATLEGFELAGEGSQAFGGAALVLIGAAVAFLALTGVSSWLDQRRRAARATRARRAVSSRCSSRSASACTTSARASRSARPTPPARWRSARSSSSASRCTTRPRASRSSRRSRTCARRSARLALLGLIAGAPAVLGAWIGAAAFNSSLAAFLFGFGAGAIVQVIVQLAPSLRDGEGRTLHPVAVTGLLAGMALMFATGLLVSV